ncbi:MAG: nitroreductase family deazaflavin-dependent oxidoreductase [Thermanaerothrix sp.]|nr:nitroreductase family deazaflavin-dependent oxidoreductase [Thermanaerothrix sp.]
MSDQDQRHKHSPAYKLARVFHYFNRLMVLLWRLGLGPWFNFWPTLTGRMFVLVHSGRRSGKRYYTPLNYAVLNGEIYCTAGFGSTCDWYRNLQANPQVEIWLPDGWWVGLAEEILDPELRWEALKAVLASSGPAAPLFGVSPRLDENILRQRTAAYRVIRLRRVAPRTGANGPGDLAWVWPLITLWVWLRARRDHRRRKS